ncbi:MAG: hypothetical protein ABI587_01585 [Gemmatimonadales bacterium]
MSRTFYERFGFAAFAGNAAQKWLILKNGPHVIGLFQDAALSFFIGQAKVTRSPIRIPGLLALRVVAVLVMLFDWLWRVRVRRSYRNVVVLSAPENV